MQDAASGLVLAAACLAPPLGLRPLTILVVPRFRLWFVLLNWPWKALTALGLVLASLALFYRPEDPVEDQVMAPFLLTLVLLLLVGTVRFWLSAPDWTWPAAAVALGFAGLDWPGRVVAVVPLLLWYFRTDRLLGVVGGRPHLWRVTFWLGMVAPNSRGEDPLARGVLAVARGLPQPLDPAIMTELLRLLPPIRDRLGAGLLVRGMLASARGDREEARRWLLGLVDLTPAQASREEREMAARWLCAEAARRGRWEEVLSCSGCTEGSGELASWNAQARRRVLGPAAGGETWLRLAGLGMAPPSGGPHPLEHPRPEEDPGAGRDARPACLARHCLLHLRGPDRATPEQVEEVCRSWDALSDLPPGVWDRAVEDLADLVRRGGIPLAEAGPSPTLARLRTRVTSELVSHVSEKAEALLQRHESAPPLPLAEEWLDWMNLRLAYQEACRVGGDGLAAVLWKPVHQALNHLAVQCGPPVGHEVFRWLAAEARERRDPEALELETANVRATAPAGDG